MLVSLSTEDDKVSLDFFSIDFVISAGKGMLLISQWKLVQCLHVYISDPLLMRLVLFFLHFLRISLLSSIYMEQWLVLHVFLLVALSQYVC